VTNRAQWLAERRKGIGGSDVAAILGLSKWRTCLEVYHDKIGDLPDDEVIDPRKDAGNKLQRPIIETYAELQGATITAYEPGVIRHPDLPLLANLDAIAANEEGDEWNVDAKNVHWRVADAWGEAESDEMPDDAFYQGHHYNYITARHKTDFAVLVGGEWPPRIYTVPRDDEFFEMLLGDLEQFWWHVTNRVPPPPDFAHATTLALAKRLYPDVDVTKEVTLDERYGELAARYNAISRIESLGGKKKKLLNAELLFAMGDAAVAKIKGSPFILKRAHTAPRRCKKCGFASNEEGSARFTLTLPKDAQAPALMPAAQYLIEGETT
jgi:putative phage-type endonuclease